MKHALIFVVAYFLFVSNGLSQVILSGKLLDAEDSSPIPGATIQLYNIKDSTASKFVASDGQGLFSFRDVDRAFYKLKVKSMGYKPYSRLMRVGEESVDLGAVNLQPDSKVLESVQVDGKVVPMEQKGDTIVYNADAYKVNPDANTKDLVSKMAGIVVESSGVTANGETVEQVLLDGKRFFGKDPLLSLNSIPADVVDKVEVYDEQSERSRMTGVDDGNTTKTMNVVTKEDKRTGVFGNAYAGYGTDDRYSAGFNVSAFDKDKRLTVIGMSNDVNQQNFSSEDLAGISGGRRRGMRSGQSDNSMTGAQEGISQTHALGTNYVDDLGEKALLEGSYFFNQGNNVNDQVLSRETFNPNGNQIYNEQKSSNSTNDNHRLNTRLEYNINDKNMLVVKPSLSYQKNESNEHTLGRTETLDGEELSSTDNVFSSNVEVFNFSNDLTFVHKFEKIGRSISFDLNTNYKTSDDLSIFSDNQADSIVNFDNQQIETGFTAKALYSEPVWSAGILSAGYEIQLSQREFAKEAFEGGDAEFVESQLSALSGNVNSDLIAHRGILNFTNTEFGKFFNIGLVAQSLSLQNNMDNGRDERKTYLNLLPVAMGKLDIGKSSSIFFRYKTSTVAPSTSQLLEVVDNTNPLFVSLGNADLDQSYQHNLMLRFQKVNVDKNTSLSNFTRLMYTKDYVGNETAIVAKDTVINGVALSRGAQVSKPVNLDGYWSAINSTTYSFIVPWIKSKMNLTANGGYVRLPGVNDDEMNISETWTAGMKLSLVSNISENFDFNIFYKVDGNWVENSVESIGSNRYSLQNIGGKINVIFGNGFVFRSDWSHQIYHGVNEEFNTQYTLWNMALAKKFLKDKSAEVEVSVYDLLGQNQSVSQTVNASYIEERNVQVLQQYFMVKLSYTLRHFKKA
ncbi:outer membrane beta-barrel protein [Aureibacter tunicatorum]|uniref:Outer membrane protein beta-barrel domain-containing protein n=1 Tax=Aureibacter tunicatorum TaxID=866807 RepID=A0AAE4BSW0_9BACT|nr:outer membrane beta-barrel protein [Aureibacter tunicatorum]MDR6238842.1 hypothetical protein [Aureibacter tunicatorum]BDD05231.1 collagen-binding protein [Aureibacter tunicatorum]